MTLTMVERWVLNAVPVMPEVATARRVAEQLPSLSRTTVDKTLRKLASSHLMVLEGSQGRTYTRYVEGSLL